jgi:oligosaccharide repeat unit polymerase
MNYAIVFGCLAGIALVVWISAKFFAHPVSPFSVFYGVWFTALALYNMNWIAYTPVRRSAWTLIGLSFMAFGVGWLIPYLGWDPHALKSPDWVRRQVSTERLRIVIGICFVLGAIGLAAFLFNVQATVGLSAYVDSAYLVREAMAKGGDLEEPLKAFDWLNVANVVLCSFYLFTLKGPRRLVIVSVLTFSLVALFLMEDRTHFFYAFCWAGFVQVHSMKVNARRLIAMVAAGVALLLVQFLVVAAWMGKVLENNATLMEVASVQTAIIMPYMYVTASIPALQVHIDSSPKPTHGSMTFYPLFKIWNLIDPTLEPPPVVAEFVSIPFEGNTFTWLQQFYDDFGVPGVVIGPWIIGILTSVFYFHMLSTRSFYSTLITGVFSYLVALTVFANHFTQGPAWYFLVVCLVVAVCVTKHESICDYGIASTI